MNIFRKGRVHAACWLLALTTLPMASQAQRVLMQGPAGAVTDAEIAVDAATRFSDTARSTMLGRPGTVEQLAMNLYAQRAMAAEAERKGLATGETAAVALRLAREKALADLYWADFDKSHQPSIQALEAYAQSTYRATPEDVLKAPARARVSHILIRGKTPENRAKLEQWLKQAQTGEIFARLARDHSEDAGSASKGGDLGYAAEEGMLPPPLEAAMKLLQKPGDMSSVVESPFGYHIIRLEDRRPEGKRGFDEMREQLLLNARATLVREARASEVQRLQAEGQPQQAAIEGYASQFAPAEREQ